jgi:hypothetical protein
LNSGSRPRDRSEPSILFTRPLLAAVPAVS